MCYRFFRALLLFLLMKPFFRLKAVGLENIPKRGGFILAGNHVSFLDPVALGCACPRTLSYMARDDLFRIPLLGLWMRAVGCIPVKRKSADLSALKEAIRRVKLGGVLGLFPEGTRNPEGKLKAESGVGFLAAKLNVPVIPANLTGTDKALPPDAKFLRAAEIRVVFGKPVAIRNGAAYDEIADAIMNDIRKAACGYDKQNP